MSIGALVLVAMIVFGLILVILPGPVSRALMLLPFRLKDGTVVPVEERRARPSLVRLAGLTLILAGGILLLSLLWTT